MYTPWALVGLFWGLVLVPYMLLRGGPVERYGVAIYALGWGASFLLQEPGGDNGPGLKVFFVDILVMVGFIVLSAWSRKIWTLCAAAFALAAVLCHIAGLIGKVSFVAYVTGISLWGGYGLLCALTAGVIGVELERYRRRRQNAKS
jgi:hypothetical protein